MLAVLYFSGGQEAISFWIADSRLPGLGWSLRNCGPLDPWAASFLKKSAIDCGLYPALYRMIVPTASACASSLLEYFKVRPSAPNLTPVCAREPMVPWLVAPRTAAAIPA